MSARPVWPIWKAIFCNLILIIFLCLAAGVVPAQSAYRGALMYIKAPISVPNSFYKAEYVNLEFTAIDYDTDHLIDKSTNKQFVIRKGVFKIRLKCGVIWDENPNGSRQLVILKNGSFYPQITPHNQSAISGTTTDFSTDTHVISVAPGDTFQCAAWQKQPRIHGPAVQVRVGSFSIEIVE